MYSDPRQALDHAKTLMKYNPNAEQLNALHDRIDNWLKKAKQKDADNAEKVGKYAAPYEWLMMLVNRVIKNEISCADAVQEIREYERE